MNTNDYTQDQKLDIEQRVSKARVLLKELHLRPSCVMQMVNLGKDVFGTQSIPFLQDELYTPVKSPLSP